MTKSKVLIADDDRQMLDILRLNLVAAGYEVTCAQDGYQAVQFARRDSPDLMILDINMPAGNGFTVHDRIKHMDDLAGISILFLTGDRSEDTARLVAGSGAVGVIHKPYEAAELLERVSFAIAHRQAVVAHVLDVEKSALL